MDGSGAKAMDGRRRSGGRLDGRFLLLLGGQHARGGDGGGHSSALFYDAGNDIDMGIVM